MAMPKAIRLIVNDLPGSCPFSIISLPSKPFIISFAFRKGKCLTFSSPIPLTG
jgi:hypothetical protein